MIRSIVTAGAAAVPLRGRLAAAAAAAYTADAQQSRLEFVGVQAGAEFKGVFHKFSAAVDFAPDALASSLIDVQIDMNSVDSMDKDRDTTIRGHDVFDIAHFPTAHYVTQDDQQDRGGLHRGRRPDAARRHQGRARSNFNSRPRPAGAKLDGSARLKRLDFGVGQGDWKSTEWVGRRRENQFFPGAQDPRLRSLSEHAAHLRRCRRMRGEHLEPRRTAHRAGAALGDRQAQSAGQRVLPPRAARLLASRSRYSPP